MLRCVTVLLAVLPLSSSLALADSAHEISLPMWQQGAGGYYLSGVFSGGVRSDLLVDTGSSYVVLSRDTFTRLDRDRSTVFLRTVRGTTASGRVVEARVYSVSELALGEGCILRDVEAVALPGADRDILGLSALRRLQPFTLQFEPAALSVSGCRYAEEVTLATTVTDHPAGG